MTRRKRICLVCSAPGTFEAFLAPMVHRLADAFDVTVIMNGLPASVAAHRATFHQVGLERSVMLWRDGTALIKLVRVFSRERFDAVHSFTPKAGLLAMLAARIASIPFRFHTFTGQVWATRKGASRWLLKSTDRLLAMCATEVLTDSPSQLQFLAHEGIIALTRGQVLGSGSICGVNLERFRPSDTARVTVRKKLGLEAAALVYLFIGRMNLDKGLLDLGEAFRALIQEDPKIHLVLVGPDEENIESRIRESLGGSGEGLHIIGPTRHPEEFMQAADVLCLPSYREGFGSVLIEGAACGLPCIASRIYGITDAVTENATGLLHAPKDVLQLSACMRLLRDQPALRLELGHAARERACKHFSQAFVMNALLEFYVARLCCDCSPQLT